MTHTNSKLLIVVLSLMQLAGCAQLSRATKQEVASSIRVLKSSTQADNQQNSDDSKILTFVASAKEGESRWIRNGKGLVSYLVSVGDSYHAASGRYCHRYSELTREKETKWSKCLSRVACRDSEGHWYVVRRIVNIEWPENDVTKCPNQRVTGK